MPDSFDIEFHQIFDRTSEVIPLKDAYGTNAINQRLEQRYFELEGKRLGYIERGEKTPKNLIRELQQIENLLKQSRFQRRVINELISNPDGIVALTIRYGRGRARQVMLQRRRKRIGTLRRVTRSRRRR